LEPAIVVGSIPCPPHLPELVSRHFRRLMMPELNYVTSGDLDHMREVLFVKQALSKIGIFLEGFDIRITGVYTKPRPFGFDFDCKRPRELLALARGKAELNEDKDDTLEGAFSAGATNGTGFRQIGTGPRLHLEIAMDGKCNVHIDSHAYVVGAGQYDWNRGLEHGYWDLLSDKVPGLFGSFGDQGQVGAMVRPIKGVDGVMRWVIGLTGHW
jgi:hypothetical protein